MISWLPPKSQTSAQYVFSLYQFWYVHILTYSLILPRHSIYLLLAFSHQEQQSFLLYSQLLSILFVICRLLLKSQTSAQYVFSLYQFWYVHIVLYTIILPIQSIYLLLAFSKQEQQSFLLYTQLLSILFMICWLLLKSQTSAPYVFSLYQFWYVHIVLYTIILPIESIYLLLAFSNQE